jgi:hypothetical protein
MVKTMENASLVVKKTGISAKIASIKISEIISNIYIFVTTTSDFIADSDSDPELTVAKVTNVLSVAHDIIKKLCEYLV